MSLLLHLSRLSLFLLLPLAVFLGWIHAEEAPATSLEEELAEWDAFLNETDLFLEEANDPLADLDPDFSTQLFWSVSLRAGAGHSTNFLKRGDAISSPFIKLEADFLLSANFDQTRITSLLYFEGTQYERNASVDQEAIVFLHANWTRIRRTHSYGAELNAFYGDQIYDASLLANDFPTGASLRQFRPELAIFGDWDLSRTDSLKATLSLRRTIFEDEDEDHWRPGVSIEWNRAWSGSLLSRTELAVYREYYDDEIARTDTGLGIFPEQDLELTGIQIEQTLTWKPVRWEFLGAGARVGAAWEEDPEDSYDALARYWASIATTLDLDFARITLSGNWHNTRYDDRRVSSLDPRPVRQVYRTLQLEIEKSLRWNISIKGRVQWNDFDSRVSADSFSERRVQALLDWTY